MLQGAFAPPSTYEFPAHRLGSISLWGGAKSNCAQPHNISFGKNIRSFGPASCQMPELAEEPLPLLLTDAEVCVCATEIEIKTGTARIQAHFFIAPPKLNRAPHCKPSEKYGPPMASSRAPA